MFTPSEVIAAFLLPGLDALVIGLLARLLAGRVDADRPPRGGWVLPLAVGRAFYGGYLGYSGWPGWPPRDATGFLPFAVAAAALLGVVSCLPRVPRIVTYIAGVVAVSTTVWLIMGRAPEVRKSSAPLGYTAAVVAAAAAISVLYQHVSSRAPARDATMFTWAMTAAVASMILVNGHSLRLGAVAGILVAATLPAAVVTVGRTSRLAPAAVPFAAALAGVLLCGRLFADVTATDALLVAVAPLAASVVLLPPIRRLTRWPRAAVALAAVAVVLAIPGVPAARGLAETAREQSGPPASPY